jgi:glycosyltransferase involved in cell wall biosynthesis
MSNNRLQLCMIVRDSSRTLEPVQRSIGSYVGEMIVVDNGSTDSMPEIIGNAAHLDPDNSWNRSWQTLNAIASNIAAGGINHDFCHANFLSLQCYRIQCRATTLKGHATG